MKFVVIDESFKLSFGSLLILIQLGVNYAEGVCGEIFKFFLQFFKKKPVFFGASLLQLVMNIL